MYAEDILAVFSKNDGKGRGDVICMHNAKVRAIFRECRDLRPRLSGCTASNGSNRRNPMRFCLKSGRSHSQWIEALYYFGVSAMLTALFLGRDLAV